MNLDSRLVGWFLLVFTLTRVVAAWGDDAQAEKPKFSSVRKFMLNYEVAIRSPAKASQIRVWLPIAQSTEHQKVTVTTRRFPVPIEINSDPTFGNRIVYFESAVSDSESIHCQISYRVERKEVLGLPGESQPGPTSLTEAERKLHLLPNKRIPLTGKSQQLIADLPLSKDQLSLGRLFYNRVDELVKYDKSRPGYGTGDSEWVCDSRFGNCTDFHSLFIAWSRARQLPARFEIGFPLPDKRGQGEIQGYHCWAFFHVDGHGWVPVDISEADKNPAMKEYYFGHLTDCRVTMSQGRDIELVPRQAGEPLNFFVYPYVEVDGKELSKDHVKLTVTFRDE